MNLKHRHFSFLSNERQKCSSKFLEKYAPLEAIGKLKIWRDTNGPDFIEDQAIIGNGNLMMTGLENNGGPVVNIMYEGVKYDIPIDLILKPKVSKAVDVTTNAMVDFETGVLTKSICTQMEAHCCLHSTHKLLVHRKGYNFFI